jgi:hypothetical protein
VVSESTLNLTFDMRWSGHHRGRYSGMADLFWIFSNRGTASPKKGKGEEGEGARLSNRDSLLMARLA